MIEGKVVNVTSLMESDKEKIFHWVNQPSLKKDIGTIYPISDIEHEKWFDNVRLDNSQKIFGIRDKDNNLHGIIGLKNINFMSSNAELYIYIGSSESRGKGYATDALHTVLDFAFNRLNLHKVYLRVFDYNINAINLYKKTGFKIDGKLRDEHFINGEYHDVLIMSILNN